MDELVLLSHKSRQRRVREQRNLEYIENNIVEDLENERVRITGLPNESDNFN